MQGLAILTIVKYERANRGLGVVCIRA